MYVEECTSCYIVGRPFHIYHLNYSSQYNVCSFLSLSMFQLIYRFKITQMQSEGFKLPSFKVVKLEP